MTMESHTPKSAGFIELLALLFIALKLCGIIDWSWMMVLSPIWISFGIFAVTFIIFMIISKLEKTR